jgi:hypothetical protein
VVALPQERRHHRVAGGEALHMLPHALHHSARGAARVASTPMAPWNRKK